jgi:hypothetical protein
MTYAESCCRQTNLAYPRNDEVLQRCVLDESGKRGNDTQAQFLHDANHYAERSTGTVPT